MDLFFQCSCICQAFVPPCKLTSCSSAMVHSIANVEGPPHQKKFVCSVQVSTIDGTFQMSGEERSRVKDAENCAASLLIRALQESNYL